MIHAGQKARPRAARIALNRALPRVREILPRPAPQGQIHRLPVQARGGGHVFGALEPAFDLERADAQLDQTRHGRACLEILRREQVGALAEIHDLPVDQQFVRQATGLRAGPAVGTSTADRFARQTLTRIGDAQGAVHEYFQLDSRAARDLLDVRQAQLAREHDAIRAERGGQLHRCRVGASHLRGSVDAKTWCNLPHQAERAEILHDHRVDARALRRADHFGPSVELGVEDQRVQGEVSFDPPRM